MSVSYTIYTLQAQWGIGKKFYLRPKNMQFYVKKIVTYFTGPNFFYRPVVNHEDYISIKRNYIQNVYSGLTVYLLAFKNYH